jgi:hypothetical protein
MIVAGQLELAGAETLGSLPVANLFTGRIVQVSGVFYIYSGGWIALAPVNNPTFTGTVTGTFSGNLTGNVTGNLTGNVTGNVTGNLTGNVTGNASGTASNVTGTVAIANGGTGQTSQTAGFNALSPMTTKGDIIAHNGTNNIRLAVGTNGYGLVADSAQASGLKWAAMLSNPMTTTGDIILAGASGNPTRLAIGTVDYVLKSDGSTAAWGKIVDASVDAAAAIAGTKISPSFGSQNVSTTGTYNKVAITAPATGATLTLADGSTLALSGAYSTTLTAMAATAVTLPTTGTLATLAGVETFTNKTISGASNTITNVSLSAGVTGTLPIANGGTGQTTANAALNALLPSQASAAGKVLSSDGTNTSWAAALTSTLTNGYIFVGNASNVATAVAMTGDVTISNAGVTAIGSGKVTNAMLAGSIAASKLVGTDIATVGTITSGIWNAGSVTSSGSITANHSNSGATSAFTFKNTGAAQANAYLSVAGNRTTNGDPAWIVLENTVEGTSVQIVASRTSSTAMALNLYTYSSGVVNSGSISGPGAWTLGPPSFSGSHTVWGNLLVGGTSSIIGGTQNLELVAASSGSSRDLLVYNSSNTASSRARVWISNGGTSAGSADLLFSSGIAGTRWVIGVDSTASDKFKVSYNGYNVSSGTSYAECTTAGDWTFGPKTGSSLNLRHEFYSGAAVGNTTVVHSTVGGAYNSTATISAGTPGNNQIGLLYDRGNGYNHFYFSDVLRFTYSNSGNPSLAYPFATSGSGKTEYGSVSTGGAWTLGPISGSGLTAYVATAGAMFAYDNSSTYLTIFPEDAGGAVNLKFGANSGDAPNLQFKNDAGTVVAGINNDGTCVLGKTSGLGTSLWHYIYGSTNAGGNCVDFIKPTGGDTASNFYLTFSTDTTTQGAIWNNASGNCEVVTYSDSRLKENIRTADYGIKEIMDLKPVTFDWISGCAKNVKGFIAQDVEKVLPNSVGEGRDGLLLLGKDEFIPVMVRAIQQLKELLDAAMLKIAVWESK